MDVRFEDHPQFQRAAAYAAAGGGALASLLPQVGLAQAAVVGSAFAVAIGSGKLPDRPRRIAAAIGCLIAAAASIAQPRLAPLAGALLGLVFAIARNDSAKSNGAKGSSRAATALAAAFGAAAVALAAMALSPLAIALASVLPAFLSNAASGAAFGLWAGVAAIPVHVAIGGDPVETRLAALRPSLGTEIRALAERAVAARRGAAGELPPGTRADLRQLIDQLALAALDVAGHTASLTRASSPAVEEDLQRRCALLLDNAGKADDEPTRQSYRRAADALEGQLEHFRRVRRARERALARLHEDVANLERARFSLTLLRGPDCAAELDLLQDRLQHGAIAFEELDWLACPTSGIPGSTSASAASGHSRSTTSSR